MKEAPPRPRFRKKQIRMTKHATSICQKRTALPLATNLHRHAPVRGGIRPSGSANCRTTGGRCLGRRPASVSNCFVGETSPILGHPDRGLPANSRPVLVVYALFDRLLARLHQGCRDIMSRMRGKTMVMSAKSEIRKVPPTLVSAGIWVCVLHAT